MISMIALTLALALQDNPVNAGAAGAFSSEVDGQRYMFVVSHKDIENSPRWLDTDDSPPLSPGAAVRSARLLLAQLLKNGDQWEVGSVTLKQILFPDAWIYLVEFREPRPLKSGVGSRPMSLMTVVVLMSGQAVVPVSTKKQPGR